MYKNKRILAVVPARGGSKGIPLKNLRKISGVPLVGMVGQVIKQIPEIDRAVVSTDHQEIALVANSYGLESPFMRPESIAGDIIGDVDVLRHAIQETEKNDGTRYDVILMLQPTSPLRKPEHIRDAYEKLIDNNLDAVWTVSETDSKAHPLKQLLINNDKLEYYDANGSKIIARQQLQPVYHRNGVAYALTRECLMDMGSLIGNNAAPVVIEGTMISIDTEWDLQMVQNIWNELNESY